MGGHPAARRIRVLAVPPLLAAALAGVASAGPAATAAGWAGPASRLASVSGGGILNGVAATSAHRAWAVGQTGNLLSTNPKTLILRWRGGAWRPVPSPTGASGGSLIAVAVTPAGRAWAVGQTGGLVASKLATLIERWNGTRWRIVPSPNPAPGGSALNGVAVTSARSAWAVGCVACGRAKNETLILHWNGTAWTRVPSPDPATGGTLVDVAVTSASNAWAVGSTGSPANPRPKPLLERWNGTRWKIVPSPNPAPGGSILYGVAATSARSAWAVGCVACLSLRAKAQTLILHWNGAAWKRVLSPNPAAGGTLDDVAVTSASDAWAVGWTGVPGISRPKTVIERWNGAAWTRVPSPNPAGTAALFGVAAASAGSAWAVGATGRLGGANPDLVALRWNGTTWK